TDGYYTDASRNNDENTGVDNADNTAGANITNSAGASFKYSPKNPFKDSNSNTLADIAMHFWKNDLRPLVGNFVPTSASNPAFWQHMVTYGVGLGVNGTVTPADAFDQISKSNSVDWWGGNDNEDKINDLLHAAVNSRGGFFSASEPQKFSDELTDMVGDIMAVSG